MAAANDDDIISASHGTLHSFAGFTLTTYGVKQRAVSRETFFLYGSTLFHVNHPPLGRPLPAQNRAG
jgi:hypothetical protein